MRLLSQEQGNISSNITTDFLKVSEQHRKWYDFFINGYTFALIWSKQGFYLFDSHSRSAEGWLDLLKVALDGFYKYLGLLRTSKFSGK